MPSPHLSTEGLVPPVVGFMPTPFKTDHRIDQRAIAEHAARLSSGGIVPAVLGGMGEYYALTVEQTLDTIEALTDVAGRHPVVAGIGGATDIAERLAREAARLGVSTLVINPPYYYKPPVLGYSEHVERIIQASGLPVVVYSSKLYPMQTEHLAALCQLGGDIAIKEEAHDVSTFKRHREEFGEALSWWGVSEIPGLDYVSAGADVITSSLANVAPEVSQRYISQGLGAAGSTSGTTVSAVNAWHTYLQQTPEGVPAALKAAMSIAYDWEPIVLSPMLFPTQDTFNRFRGFTKQFGALSNVLLEDHV